jgi:hypothetical protein
MLTWNSEKICASGLRTTLPSTFSRPRCGMPMVTVSIPRSAARSIIACKPPPPLPISTVWCKSPPSRPATHSTVLVFKTVPPARIRGWQGSFHQVHSLSLSPAATHTGGWGVAPSCQG